MRERQPGKVIPFVRPYARLFKGMPPLVLGTIVVVFLFLQLFLIGVSLWHLYRYILAPRMGWLDPRDRFFELVRITASPYRPPEDRDRALTELKKMIPWARSTLSPKEMDQAIQKLMDSLERYETPLKYRYEILKILDLLQGKGEESQSLSSLSTPTLPAAPSPQDKGASSPAPLSFSGVGDGKKALARLRELAQLTGSDFARTQRERVRLLMEHRLNYPCDRELLPLVETLEKRNDLSPYERGVVLSTREGLRRCP